MTTKMKKRPATGPMQGYLYVDPKVTREGDSATIESADVYYKQLNEAIRGAIADGVKTITVNNVNGQRYIGTALKGKGVRIEVHGTAGNDLAMFMDGPTVEVFGNAQDGVGNTMNAGKVVIQGDAGDVLGYGMRGGRVFIKGDVGYRVGIHMKAYEDNVPVMVCGGKARDFFGEYMAGGLLVLLGMNSRIEGPLVGGYVGTGMHGGAIYLRGEVEPWQCGKEVGVFAATEEDMAALTPVLAEYCEALGVDLGEVLAEPFTKLVPVSHRPYGKMYVYA
jgi:glutamate synthase domain-containing protein 3